MKKFTLRYETSGNFFEPNSCKTTCEKESDQWQYDIRPVQMFVKSVSWCLLNYLCYITIKSKGAFNQTERIKRQMARGAGRFSTSLLSIEKNFSLKISLKTELVCAS